MIDGSTIMFGIVGDPIAQVLAPATLNPRFAARGLNAALVLADMEPGKAAALAERLGCGSGRPDPRGFDLVSNATPMGMRPEDPLPFDAGLLTPQQFVGEVVTKPPLTPLLAAAAARGC